METVLTIEEKLAERAKELHALFRLSEVVDYFDDDLEGILKAVVTIIPESMKHPDSAAAQVQVGEFSASSPQWRATPWCYRAPIRRKAELIGALTVEYFREFPVQDQGPFLREEISLVNAVAERLGKIVSRIEAQRALTAEAETSRNLNIAMKEILKQAEREKQQVEDRIQRSMQTVVMPLLDRMDRMATNCQHQPLLRLLRSNLEDIAGEFAQRLEATAGTLSLREHQICDMIRHGMSSKEIAEQLNLSLSTVHNHRERIRRKLGLQKSRTNLASYLQHL